MRGVSTIAIGLALVGCQCGPPVPDEEPPDEPTAPHLRRLTVTQVEQLTRVLFDDRRSVAHLFPRDARSDGFDTVSGVLTISELHAEALVEAGERLVDHAWRRDLGSWTRPRLEAASADDGARTDGERWNLRHGRALSVFLDAEAPGPASLTVVARLAAAHEIPLEQLPAGVTRKAVLKVSRPGGAGVEVELAEGQAPRLLELPVNVAAGENPLEITCNPSTYGRSPRPDEDPWECELLEVVARGAPGRFPERPPVLRRCEPTEGGCARELVTDLARRAWRRPATEAEVDRLLALRDVVDAIEPNPALRDPGLRAALVAILASPNFLFLNAPPPPELATAPDAPSPAALEADLQLASALSFAFWQQPPDDELLAAALEGRLADPAARREAVERLLADPRSARFVHEFAAQWLGLVKVETAVRPAMPVSLREALLAEGVRVVDAFLRDEVDFLDLFTVGETFVNGELARFYGLAPPSGRDWVRASLADTSRAGLLTLGGVLTATSLASHASVTTRGVFVLDRFLCSSPPPPPANIPLPPAADRPLTPREKAERHASAPACAGCHQVMDPIGFALAGFGVTGEELDPRPELGVSVWPDGSTYGSPAELSRLVRDDPRTVPCFADRLSTYLFGRSIAVDHRDELAELVTRFESAGRRLRPLLVDLASSDLFRRNASLQAAAP